MMSDDDDGTSVSYDEDDGSNIINATRNENDENDCNIEICDDYDDNVQLHLTTCYMHII